MDFALLILIFLAFFNSGQLLTKKILGLNFIESDEAFIFSTAVGSIFFSTLVTALVFTGWITPLVCWCILGVFLLIGWKNLLKLKLIMNSLREIVVQDTELKNLALSFLGLLTLLSIGLAMAPASATDALVHHLAVPKAFLQAGGLVNLPDNIYSFFPQQIEMLYLFALALGTDSLAQLTGLGVVFLLLFALWHYSRKKMDHNHAWLTPLIFFSTPTIFIAASSAHVALQATTYIFLAFYCWENGYERNECSWFVLMTLFAGAAISSKLNCAIILPLAILGLAVHGRNHKNVKQATIQSLILVLGSLLILSPWLVKNYFFTGNPLAPYLMNILGVENGINWDAARSQMRSEYLSSFGMGHSIFNFLSLPINLTFFSEPNSLKFDGEIGILYFLLLPTLLGLSRNVFPAIIVFLVLLAFWFQQTQTVLLLSPTLVFLSLLLVSGLNHIFKNHQGGKLEKYFLTGILAIGILFNTSQIMKEWFRVNPLSYILNKETREQFLSRQIKAYPSYDDVNKLLNKNDKVLMVYTKNLGYLMNRPFLSDTLFESHTLSEIIDKGVYAADIINRLKARGITHILFDFNQVFGKDSVLTMGERAIFKNFLIKHGEQISAKNGFLLYRFMLDSDGKQAKILLNH